MGIAARVWNRLHFSEHLVPFSEGANWDAFRGFSPISKVPALSDGDFTVWDSLGIVAYLAERHAGVWPLNLLARVWARCAAAEMHSSFSVLCERCR